jgi:hypothetical protein
MTVLSLYAMKKAGASPPNLKKLSVASKLSTFLGKFFQVYSI